MRRWTTHDIQALPPDKMTPSQFAEAQKLVAEQRPKDRAEALAPRWRGRATHLHSWLDDPGPSNSPEDLGQTAVNTCSYDHTPTPPKRHPAIPELQEATEDHGGANSRAAFPCHSQSVSFVCFAVYTRERSWPTQRLPLFEDRFPVPFTVRRLKPLAPVRFGKRLYREPHV